MPPNPRDNLRHGAVVPLDRVKEVVEDAIRRLAAGLDLPAELLATDGGNHWATWTKEREAVAAAVVERLTYFRLLAMDVATSQDDRREHWWDP
jgi:hypothetical protein